MILGVRHLYWFLSMLYFILALQTGTDQLQFLNSTALVHAVAVVPSDTSNPRMHVQKLFHVEVSATLRKPVDADEHVRYGNTALHIDRHTCPQDAAMSTLVPATLELWLVTLQIRCRCHGYLPTLLPYHVRVVF